MKGPVTQPWVHSLTHMQQTVLFTATRGPDGMRKDHPVKILLRWYRRCFLYSALDGKVFTDPYQKGGGSFTGPCTYPIDHARKDYFRYTDELPHHFQLHFIHATQILGYKHPDECIKAWWLDFYIMMVKDMHMFPEPEIEMDARLGDQIDAWRAREVVTAK